MLFHRLPPAPRKRILAYIDAPSIEAWRLVRDTIVSPGLTLFDVVEKVDRDFGWFDGSYPSSLLVARASAYVEKRWMEMDEFELSFLTEDPDVG